VLKGTFFVFWTKKGEGKKSNGGKGKNGWEKEKDVRATLNQPKRTKRAQKGKKI